MEHKLKTWPDVFAVTQLGMKNFELRKNDRNFKVGDILYLSEYDPETKEYTGRDCIRRVNYILHGGRFGLPKDYVIMGIERLKDNVIRTATLGIKSKEVVISDNCRTIQDDAFEVGIEHLRQEYNNLCKTWPIGKDVKFHLVLTIER